MKFKNIFKKNMQSPLESKELKQRTVFSTFYDLNNTPWSSGGYETFAEQGYIRNVIANYSANLIARSLSSVPLLLAHYNKEGIRKNVTDHKMLDLFRRPNPFMSGIAMLEHIAMHQMLSGNAYILKIRDNNCIPREMHVLRPDKVTIQTRGNNIASYTYINNNTRRIFRVDSEGYCDLLHIKTFHPTNDIKGLSLFESALCNIKQHNEAGLWTQALLENSARPSGALVVKGEQSANLSEEQYNKLKDQIDEFFCGHRNAGRPMLLEGGLEWQGIGYKPIELDLINSKNAMAREIALAFGIPSYLLGIPGDNTYNNLSEAKTILWEQTILPMLTNILNYFNNWFRYDFAERGLVLEYDKDKISIFAEHREQMFDKLNKVNFLTINEKRSLCGFAPVNSGDVLGEIDNPQP